MKSAEDLTVGQLLAVARGDAASPADRLAVAEVGKTLLYDALDHPAVTSGVLDEARQMWGPLVDAALQECGHRPIGA